MDLVNQYVKSNTFRRTAETLQAAMDADANSLNDRLLFAVPKKGRLHTACLDLLSGSDIQFHRHNRLDIALVSSGIRLSHSISGLWGAMALSYFLRDPSQLS